MFIMLEHESINGHKYNILRFLICKQKCFIMYLRYKNNTMLYYIFLNTINKENNWVMMSRRRRYCL